MATTTLPVARRELARRLGYGEMVGADGTTWTTTTNLTTDTLVICTTLRNYGFDDLVAAASGDDIFQNWWTIILGTGNPTTVKRIKSYDAGTGTLTLAGAVLATETGAVTFEIHKYSPTLLREVLNTAARNAFPLLYVPVTRTLVTGAKQLRYDVPAAIIGPPDAIYLDRPLAAGTSGFQNNILTDGGFEIWTTSTALTNWTATTLDSIQETAVSAPLNYAVFRDTYSARCQSQTGAKGTLLQTIASPGTHSGQRITLSIWVYCLTASVVSTSISINSSETLGTTTNGGMHTGSGWELLTMSVDSKVTITTLTVGVSVVSTATDNTEFYVDEAICVVGPSQEPEAHGVQLFNWEYTPEVRGGSTLVQEVVFPYPLPPLYRLRFEGKGYLSTLSAETDVIEVGPPQTDLLYTYAIEELQKRLMLTSADQDSDYRRSMEDRMQAIKRRMLPYAMPQRARRDMGPDWGR